MLLFPLGLLLFVLLLGLPLGLVGRSWRHYFIGVAVALLGCVVPLVVFGLSSMGPGFFGPEAKNECRLGVWSCWPVGKIAATPLVMFSAVAFYVWHVLWVLKKRLAGFDLDMEEELAREGLRMPAWVQLGLLSGALFSFWCVGFGLVVVAMEPRHYDVLLLFLAVPFYVGFWYGNLWWIGCCSIARKVQLWIGLLVNALFLPLTYWLSAKTYAELPEVRLASDCFVVTAASRGHACVVGERREVDHKGRRVWANAQLRTFWAFEARWKARRPRSHAAFRRVYNRVGPLVARRVRHPLLADAVYLLLKPLAWVVRRCGWGI